MIYLIRLTFIQGCAQDTEEIKGQSKIDKAVENLSNNIKPQKDGEVKTESVSPGAEQKGSRSQQEDAEAITRGVQEAIPSTQGAQRSPRQLKKEQDSELESYARKSGSFMKATTTKSNYYT